MLGGFVIPAKAGIQVFALDTRLRGCDGTGGAGLPGGSGEFDFCRCGKVAGAVSARASLQAVDRKVRAAHNVLNGCQRVVN